MTQLFCEFRFVNNFIFYTVIRFINTHIRKIQYATLHLVESKNHKFLPYQAQEKISNPRSILEETWIVQYEWLPCTIYQKNVCTSKELLLGERITEVQGRAETS